MKKPLYEIEGTVANAMFKHMNELNGISTLGELKQKTVKILQSDEITQKNAVDRFIEYVNKANNKAQLLSIITTFICGDKVVC